MAGLILIALHYFLFVLIFLFSILYSRINPSLTSLMIYRQIVNHQKSQPRIFIPLKNTTKKVQYMVISVEDFKFYKHIGIDLEAICNAYTINKKVGYKYFGGSTITQQLARTLFLVPTKSYLRKYIEILIALEINIFIPKDRVLELYLNNIEFGKGIYGIGKAAWFYYGKSFYKLTKNEIIKLITILPNPIKYSPFNFTKNRNLVVRYYFLASL